MRRPDAVQEVNVCLAGGWSRGHSTDYEKLPKMMAKAGDPLS
jgi:hypothetical protein